MCNLGEAVELRGIEKGAEKRAIADAIRMLKKGKLSYEEIAEYCDLPLSVIEELAKANPVS